jgi:hypothetical protein
MAAPIMPHGGVLVKCGNHPPDRRRRYKNKADRRRVSRRCFPTPVLLKWAAINNSLRQSKSRENPDSVVFLFLPGVWFLQRPL